MNGVDLTNRYVQTGIAASIGAAVLGATYLTHSSTGGLESTSHSCGCSTLQSASKEPVLRKPREKRPLSFKASMFLAFQKVAVFFQRLYHLFLSLWEGNSLSHKKERA